MNNNNTKKKNAEGLSFISQSKEKGAVFLLQLRFITQHWRHWINANYDAVILAFAICHWYENATEWFNNVGSKALWNTVLCKTHILLTNNYEVVVLCYVIQYV